MSHLDHLTPLFKATQKLGGGIMVLDRSWKIAYSNQIIREIYSGFSFSSDAIYDDLIWHCVNNRTIDAPDLYADPNLYIGNLKDVLSIKPLHKWLCVHSDGSSYMMAAKHIFGGGSVHLCMELEKAGAVDMDGLLLVNADIRADAMSRLLTMAGDGTLTIPLRPALELTPVAVAIVTDSGKLLERNGEFARMLDAGDGIRLVGGDIQATDEMDRPALRGAVELMAAPTARTGRRILRLGRTGGETPLAVIVSKAPFSPQKMEAGAVRGLACLAIVDPGRQSTPATEVLMELFGLTQAEARVALQIGAGKSINETAGEFGVKVGTVRSQVTSIFAKTGLNRQQEVALFVRDLGDLSRLSGGSQS
jgi:DNA-binding CsgD family transcriptional regulator/PAS domain-containing protein